MDELLSAQYAIALENPEPCNFSSVPNIIDHLTYDFVDPITGETKSKRLSVYAKELYRILKSVAGQSHICWMNTENLAELANMSKSSISECKRELQQKFHQLDNTPLIEVTEKKKITKKEDEKINGTHFHQVTIKTIWGYNRAFFLLKKMDKQKGACSLSERAYGHVRQANAPSQGACSLSELNKTDCYKIPLSERQDTTAIADPVCSLEKENSVFDEKTYAFNWLKKHGCNTNKAVHVSTSFSSAEIKKAIEYTEKAKHKALKNQKPMTNPIAYLIKTLENKYWEAKSY